MPAASQDGAQIQHRARHPAVGEANGREVMHNAQRFGSKGIGHSGRFISHSTADRV